MPDSPNKLPGEFNCQLINALLQVECWATELNTLVTHARVMTERARRQMPPPTAEEMEVEWPVSADPYHLVCWVLQNLSLPMDEYEKYKLLFLPGPDGLYQQVSLFLPPFSSLPISLSFFLSLGRSLSVCIRDVFLVY